MVTKKEEEAETKKSVKTKEPKRVLLDLVIESDTRLPVIVAGLVESGIYKQYEEQLKGYGKLDFEPTITESEFNKIIRKMEGA